VKIALKAVFEQPLLRRVERILEAEREQQAIPAVPADQEIYQVPG
jgi:hypothetical protein